MPASSKLFCFVLGQLLLSVSAVEVWKAGCTATLNGGTRNCCASTGLCQDSSCTVFGFKNSAKSNCNPQQCPKVQCNFVSTTCSATSDGRHCYGYVACQAGSNCNANDLIGSLCLQDGASDNFKICGPGKGCQNTNQCDPGQTCIDSECVTNPSPSPLPASPLPSSSPATFGGQGTVTDCPKCNALYKTQQCADIDTANAGSLTIDLPGVVADDALKYLQQATSNKCTKVLGCDETIICDTFIAPEVFSGLASCTTATLLGDDTRSNVPTNPNFKPVF